MAKRTRKSALRSWMYAGVVVAGVGIVWASRRRPRIKPGQRLLVVGDSMAEGLSPYLKALAADDQVGFASLFKRGTRIGYWRTRPEFLAALDPSPSLVLFVLGTNDQVGAHTESPREAAELAAAAESRGARVAWIGAPTLTQGNDLADSLERVFGREYFDSRMLNIPRAPDGLHPSVEGAAGWARSIWEWLH